MSSQDYLDELSDSISKILITLDAHSSNDQCIILCSVIECYCCVQDKPIMSLGLLLTTVMESMVDTVEVE